VSEADPRELARLATGGDLEAFELLIRRFERRVYGFSYHQLRDYSEAQDLTQEIFVRLYQQLDRFDSSRPFEPWFWRLAANAAINYRRRRVPIPKEIDTEDAGPPPPDADLLEALGELDPAYRLPLLLHYYADLPMEHVAAALRLSVNGAKSRLHRARALLRRLLEETR
jgi:RNA polymerase sigma-70 factor (ECF subfamily)